MMRLVWVILMLTAMGVALTDLRRRQDVTRAEIHRLGGRLYRVRRTLWEQEPRLSERMSAQRIEQDWPTGSLRLAPPGADPAAGRVAGRQR